MGDRQVHILLGRKESGDGLSAAVFDGCEFQEVEDESHQQQEEKCDRYRDAEESEILCPRPRVPEIV